MVQLHIESQSVMPPRHGPDTNAMTPFTWTQPLSTICATFAFEH